MSKNPALTFFVLVGIILVSCITSPSEKDTISIVSLQGGWHDQLDTLKLGGGSVHNLAFKDDSFFLKIYEFTDIVLLGDTCYSSAYTQFMKGIYAIGLQDSITLDGIYVDSLKNPMPVCECKYGPRQSGKYQVSFKGKLEGNVLRLLTLPILYEPEWVLKKE